MFLKGSAGPSAAALCLALLVPAGAVRAEQLPEVLTELSSGVQNDSDRPLACGVLLAHWFRIDFPTTAPGDRLAIPLQLDQRTEAVYLYNVQGHPMASETLFCGYAGGAWRDIALPSIRELALRAAEQADATLHCQADGSETPACALLP
ncbi:hypothetical protein [Devosia sp. A369]